MIPDPELLYVKYVLRTYNLSLGKGGGDTEEIIMGLKRLALYQYHTCLNRAPMLNYIPEHCTDIISDVIVSNCVMWQFHFHTSDEETVHLTRL